MIVGVTKGYEKKLEIVGVGYLAAIQKGDLQLRVGFANEVHLPIPEGLTVTCPDQTHIVIKGMDKQMVGQFAAEVRAVRKPEPYKGKGIRYDNEVVRRKAGKAMTQVSLATLASANGNRCPRSGSRAVNHDRALVKQRTRRRWRVRKRIRGTAQRPRLAVFRSHKHVYAQLIDDQQGRTLAAASTLEEELRTAGEIRRQPAPPPRPSAGPSPSGPWPPGSSRSPSIAAPAQYHGRVAALADAARKAGLDF